MKNGNEHIWRIKWDFNYSCMLFMNDTYEKIYRPIIMNIQKYFPGKKKNMPMCNVNGNSFLVIFGWIQSETWRWNFILLYQMILEGFI